MDWLTTLPILLAIFVLMGFSAFFSASEAALFYLRERDLRQMARGGSREVMVTKLLATPERVLSGILFWNLLVNMATFALTSLVSLRLEEANQTAAAVAFAFFSVFAIIFFAETLPKSIAVLTPRWFATICVGPISLAVRLLDPLLPLLSAANDFSLRVIWPTFKAEPYLALSDLERAVQMSGSDATLDPREQRALENIVTLADRRVDEWMRPIGNLPLFSPPVTIERLRQKNIRTSYVLISEPDSDEVAKVLWLPGLINNRHKKLDTVADPVVFLPGCTTNAAGI
jgi:CBS domain containing-hemolysin-like protein